MSKKAKSESSYAMAVIIAKAAPNALFCGFKTYFDQRTQKLVKMPVGKDGRIGVAAGCPPERLFTSAEVIDGKSLPNGAQYWGVYMSGEPIKVGDGILTCLDADYKHAVGPVSNKFENLSAFVMAEQLLYETSHSGHGFHVWLVASLDACLPAKVNIAEKQDVEIFGQPNSDAKQLLLTGDDLTGNLGALYDVADLLTSSGVAEDLAASSAAPPSPRRAMLGATPTNSSVWRTLNDAALQNMDAWVPAIFPKAVRNEHGYRITSASLGRDLEEDISIHRKGIKDFGVHDLGDARRGGRTAIDLIIEHQGCSLIEAAEWLGERLGISMCGPTRPSVDEFDFTLVDSKTREIATATNMPFVQESVEPPERDQKVVVDLLERIAGAVDLEDLNYAVRCEIKAAKGVGEYDMEQLAQALKLRAKQLGSSMSISSARETCFTDEQKKHIAMQQKARRANIAKGRPEFRIGAGQLAANTSKAVQMLDKICFYRGVRVVRLTKGMKGHEVVEANATWIAREMSERAVFFDEYFRQVDCPERLARTMADGAADGAYRHLAGVARAPFMREDGTICAINGYDSLTGLWVDMTIVPPVIAEKPTEADAIAAARQLLNLVSDFPFSTKVSRGAWLADLIGAVLRSNLPTMPAAVYTAPMPGTGKSLLAKLVDLIAYGFSYFDKWPSTEEELGKKLTSSLDAGDAVISFDNVPNGAGIHSANLAQFLTTEYYQDRRLGATERIRYANRIRVVLTGNNITLTNDCARRGIVIELDLNAETPRGREFEIDDIASHVINRRGELLGHVLTIARAYRLASQKHDIRFLESFEKWSAVVQGAVVWLSQADESLGLADPVEAVQFDEGGVGLLGHVFSQLDSAMTLPESTFWKVSEIVAMLTMKPELVGLLTELDCNDPKSAKSLGHWLKSNRNRVAGGFKLVSQRDTHTKVNTWRLEPVKR
jgi:hypothetical protein